MYAPFNLLLARRALLIAINDRFLLTTIDSKICRLHLEVLLTKLDEIGAPTIEAPKSSSGLPSKRLSPEEFNALRSEALAARQDLVAQREAAGFGQANVTVVETKWPIPAPKPGN